MIDFESASDKEHDPNDDNCGCVDCIVRIAIIKGVAIFESISTDEDKRTWLIFDRLGTILQNILTAYALWDEDDLDEPPVEEEFDQVNQAIHDAYDATEEAYQHSLVSESGEFRLPPSIATFNSKWMDFLWELSLRFTRELNGTDLF